MNVEKHRGSKDDPVTQLFSQLDLDEPALKEYALSEPSKNYTRNLVATDNETYTLLLLCWNPGKQSPIHDHPCDGCWVRVCEGEVKETRYELNKDDNSLDVTSTETYKDNKAVSYINDYMGYHKVENPSNNTPAVTLHLYCPPFEKCKIWLDPSNASLTSNVCMCNYSEYGDSHACNRFAVNMI
jgi:cysteine dioxygenase